MSETVIRIRDDGKVQVESDRNGVKNFKQITPDSLVKCIDKSRLQGALHTGLLPKHCLSFSAFHDGCREAVLTHPENSADISYFGTEYKNFPLPRLVFGFRLTPEGRLASCRLGVVENTEKLKPETRMYHYPLSNVSGFHLCTGNNPFPKCESLHTLGSIPYYILSMPNNNDYFQASLNRRGMEMRDLLEFLKDKESTFYYSDILIPNGAVLDDFINGGR